MVNRKLVVSFVATALLPASALAVQSPTSLRAATGERELASGAVVRPVAAHQFRASADPGAARAWSSFTTQMGSSWATWADGHPRQIIGEGLDAPGTIASAAEAERVAWEVLGEHVDLLAPGSSVGDFVLVSNLESGGIRSVGFVQHSAGREVIGGQIGLSFSHDRLVMITSTAKTDVFVPIGAARVGDLDARDRARDWIELDFSPSVLNIPGAIEGPFVLPVGDATTGPRYREVVRVDVKSEAPLGRWAVYLDAQTGEPVARESKMHHASGLVFYSVAERSPILGRSDRAVPFTEHVVDGAPQVSDAVGFVSFGGPTATVQPGLSGPFVEMLDESGPLASGSLPLSDGGGVTWNLSGDEFFDAQLTTYAHLQVVKNYVRTLDPTLNWLDGTIVATVNIDDQCNAMSDGDSVYFLRAGEVCENTGRMSDVVYHEFGHSVHHQSIIPGVGAFEGALSEGISDYLAATLVNDSGMGRGFFYTEEPLRELDPQGFEWTYPEDDGPIHDAGRIIGGTLWDLRNVLMAKHGVVEGVRRTDIIWYEGTRRAIDMPSMYGAALLANDDDGNLANGTPDGCEINAVFGTHGLFAGTGETAERVSAETVPEGLHVHLDLALPSFEACPIEATARVEWRLRDGDPTVQTVEMLAGPGGFDVVLPALPDGQVMNYRAVVNYSVGAERVVPANAGDPWFEHWFGPVEPIYCTSFEDGFADGWTLPPRWEVAPPQGLGGDPSEPDGADPFVLGLDLSSDGFYQPWSTEVAQSPDIAIPDGFESIRLHYKRWLTVEDGFYDQAFIYANDAVAWSNYGSPTEDASTHHRDSQWVFHDVDLTPWATDGAVSVAFDLTSDGGLEMGGWTLDEFCVVGVRQLAPPVGCGNGVLDDAEGCDDGNTVSGDGCSSQCQVEDGPVDDGGPGDDPEDPSDDGGNDGGLTDDGRLLDRGCACQAGPGDGFPASFGLLALLMLGWRRRSA